ncbi:MAG: hypothetical protein ACYTGN_12420 [Planctomycetota bacterium]
MSLQVVAIALSAVFLVVAGVGHARWKRPGILVLGLLLTLSAWGVVLLRDTSLTDLMTQLSGIELRASYLKHKKHPVIAEHLSVAREESGTAARQQASRNRNAAKESARRAIREYSAAIDLDAAAVRTLELRARAEKARAKANWIDHPRVARERGKIKTLLDRGRAAFDAGRFHESGASFLEAQAQAGIAVRVNREGLAAAAEIEKLKKILDAPWSKSKPVEQAFVRVLKRYRHAVVPFDKGEFRGAQQRAKEALTGSRSELELNSRALKAEQAAAEWARFVEEMGRPIYVRVQAEWKEIEERTGIGDGHYREARFTDATTVYAECVKSARPLFERHQKAAQHARELRASIKVPQHARLLMGVHNALQRNLARADLAINEGRFDDVGAPISRARVNVAEIERKIAVRAKNAVKALSAWQDLKTQAPKVWYDGIAVNVKAALRRGGDAQAAYDRGEFATAVALADAAVADLKRLLVRHAEMRGKADRARSEWRALAERASLTGADITEANKKAGAADVDYGKGTFDLAARGYREAIRIAQRALP